METQALIDMHSGRQLHNYICSLTWTYTSKVMQRQDNTPVAEISGLPHRSHQSVDSLSLPLVVHAHGLLHRHGDHLLKQI